MKIVDGFIMREVAGNNVVVAVGKKAKEFNGMINLNSAGAFLWKLLEKGKTEEELIGALETEYGIDREVAERDAKAFIKKLCDAGIVK